MCTLIISYRWKNEGVCMWLLRYMQDIFLELDTSLNDELVRGKINKFVSLHTIGISKNDTLYALWIKFLPIFIRNVSPCT